MLGPVPVCGCYQSVFFAQDDFGAAYRLIKDVETSTPQEYILKAVANAAIGQDSASVSKGGPGWYWCVCVFFVSQPNLFLLQRDNLKLAQNYYQLVGNAASECGKEGGLGWLCMAVAQ